MLELEAYEALSFDCYGTLIDWEGGILSAIGQVLSKHDASLNDDQILRLYATLESKAEQGEFENYKSVLRTVMEGFGRETGFKPDRDERDCLVDSLPNWQPFPDAVQALRSLKRNYKLAVISNVDDDLFSASERRLQMSFDWVVTAEQVGAYKPSLEMFTAAVERMALPGDRILHVAQSLYHDIVPAHKLGLATVWVNRRRGKEGSGATPQAHAEPDLEVPDLLALVSALAPG